MLQTSVSFLVFLTVFGRVVAGTVQVRTAPMVTLDNATVTGVTSGSTSQFLGIPFAQPPTGNLRFRLPKMLPPYNTSFPATAYGPACPQQATTLPLPSGLPAEAIDYLTNSVYNLVISSAEDCLTLNVVTPSNATPASKLPVVVWIFGGGFEFGGTNIYDGSIIVEKAISLGVPAIYVSMNYRYPFGFLASQEVKDAGVGNLGLQDQRLALQWVQKYISAFGGDPSKVTIGSPIPVGDITHGQPYYDALVAETGCSDATDTLQCLREVTYETLLTAVNQSPGIFTYQSLVLAWLPRVDGVFLTADPQYLVQQGSVADVPFINGDCDDEGTLFSLSTINITTDAQLEEYLHTYWIPNASTTTIAQLMTYYPSDPSQGSPFDTGDLNALSPQFKRIAAIQGDIIFQAPRRFFLQSRSGKQSIWTYVNKRLKTVPFLGSFHASDLLNVYGGSDMASYLVRFVTNLDPNVGESTDLYWPQYDVTTSQIVLELLDGLVPQALTTDTYRAEAIAYLTNVTLANPL
ncbi:Alpha/Beta hydrolase protein [Boletus edulis]|nr:Alpha/Beta hydrolase protein [Boletus edulis]